MVFGSQNATARLFGIQELSTTVLTSTIVGLGFDSRLAGGTGEREKLRYTVVLTMCGGAVVGATLTLVTVATVIALAALVVAAGACPAAADRTRGPHRNPDEAEEHQDRANEIPGLPGAGSADGTWRRGWSPRTGAGTVQGLGGGPADLFAATYGVDLDDFLAFGWALWAQVRGGGGVSFTRDALVDTVLNGKVADLFVETCTVPLGALRGEIVAERTSEISKTWMRYTLRNTPFVELSDAASSCSGCSTPYSGYSATSDFEASRRG